MKTHTKLIAVIILTLSAVFMFQPARAADSGTLTGTPTSVGISSSNNTASASVEIPQSKVVFLYVSANVGSASNTQSGTLLVDFAVSPDNSNWTTNGAPIGVGQTNSQVVLVPPSRLKEAGLDGLSTVTASTAIDMSKARYLRAQQFYNACGASSQITNWWTNIVVQFYTK